ncbi:hypothetical protein U1Q18_045397 [Sarracenia purpurea var. burkii]
MKNQFNILANLDFDHEKEAQQVPNERSRARNASSTLTDERTRASQSALRKLEEKSPEVCEIASSPHLVDLESIHANTEEDVGDEEEESEYITEEDDGFEEDPNIPPESLKRRKTLFEKMALDALDKTNQGRSPLNKEDLEAVIGWLAWYQGSPQTAEAKKEEGSQSFELISFPVRESIAGSRDVPLLDIIR